MTLSTLDPISMNDVSNTDSAPFVVEGRGPNALKIYFENEANRAKYLSIPLHTSNASLAATHANR